MNFEEITDFIRSKGDDTFFNFHDVLIDGKYNKLLEKFIVPKQELHGFREDRVSYDPADIRWDNSWLRAFVWGPYDDGSIARSLDFSWIILDADGRRYGSTELSFYNTLSKVTPIVFIDECFETGYDGHHFPGVEVDQDTQNELLRLLNEDFNE